MWTRRVRAAILFMTIASAGIVCIPTTAEADDLAEWRASLRAELLERITERFPDAEEAQIAYFADHTMGVVEAFSPVLDTEEYRELLRAATLRDAETVTQRFFEEARSDSPAWKTAIDFQNEAVNATVKYLSQREPEEYLAEIAKLRQHLAARMEKTTQLIADEFSSADEIYLNRNALPAPVNEFIVFLDGRKPPCHEFSDHKGQAIDVYFYSELCLQGASALERLEAQMTEFRYSGYFLRTFHEADPTEEEFEERAKRHIRNSIPGFSVVPIQDGLQLIYSPLLYLSAGRENFPTTFSSPLADQRGSLAWEKPLSRLSLLYVHRDED